MPKAILECVSGRGIVYDGEATYLIRLDRMYDPEEAGNTHLGMWVQSPLKNEIIHDAGEHPYKAVYDRLKEANRIYMLEAFRETVTRMEAEDPDHPDLIRFRKNIAKLEKSA